MLAGHPPWLDSPLPPHRRVAVDTLRIVLALVHTGLRSGALRMAIAALLPFSAAPLESCAAMVRRAALVAHRAIVLQAKLQRGVPRNLDRLGIYSLRRATPDRDHVTKVT